MFLTEKVTSSKIIPEILIQLCPTLISEREVNERTEIARVPFRGSIALFLGVTFSNLILAVGVFFVANLLSPSELGLYTVVLITPSIFSVFRGLGVNQAIVKYLAQYRAENKREEISETIITGIVFDIIIGVLFTLICFMVADVTSIYVLKRPQIAPLVRFVSILVFTNTLMAAFQSIFYGFEKMEYSSFLMTSAAILKGLLMPAFVVLGYGVLGALTGNILANVIATIMGAALLVLFYKSKAIAVKKVHFKKNLKIMLRYGIPFSISIIIGGFLIQFYNFIMAIYCDDFLIGNYKIAQNFTIVISFFTQPLTTVLLPAFSRISSKADRETIRNAFQFSVKYASIVIIPITTLMMALSEPIVTVIFNGKYPLAPLYLTLLAASSLYVGLGSLSIGNLINGLGRTDVTLKLTLIAVSVGLPLSLVLIPAFQIVGLLITSLVATIPNLLVGLWWIKRRYGAEIDLPVSLKIYLSAGLAGIPAYLTASQFTINPLIDLCLGSLIFIGIFLLSASLTGALRKDDIQTLIELGEELGPFSKIFRFILSKIQGLLLY